MVTHPEIQGDPNQGDPQSNLKTPVLIDGDTTWFEFEVELNGNKQTLQIGISTRDVYIGPDPLSGKPVRAFAITWEMQDGYESVVRIQVFQAAFISLGRLFYVIGHEGVHMIDYISDRPKHIIQWENRAWAWTYAHAWMFPWDIFPPPGVDPL